jgi:hypothetical protein
MNSQIKDKQLTDSNGNTKRHQAYANELSTLREPKKICDDTNNAGVGCLATQKRYEEIEHLVGHARDVNYNKKKIAMDTGAENQFQKPKDPTEVGLAKVTKDADHSGSSVKDKIMGTRQINKTKEKQDKIIQNPTSLSEEISSMRYLIEYMDNNNKKQIL